MIVHPDWPNTVKAFFEGMRSLGIAGQAGVFVAGWAFGWFLLWLRRKMKLG